jgi:hypothetical protein
MTIDLISNRCESVVKFHGMKSTLTCSLCIGFVQEKKSKEHLKVSMH